MNKKPTCAEILAGGEETNRWPSDVGGSNQSEDVVLTYEGLEYIVSVDRESGEPCHPNVAATVFINED